MATFRSLTDLAETSQSEMIPGLVDVLQKHDEFSSFMFANAQVTDAPSIKTNRLAELPVASVVGCDDSITPQAVSGAPVTRDLYTFNTSFDVCIQGQNLHSSITNVMQSEIYGAVRALADGVGAAAITGDGSSTITGLEADITNSFAVATSGNFDLSDMDRLFDEVRTRSQLVYLGAPATVRAVTAEMRSVGSLDYQTLAGTEMRVPSYLGIPVLRSEYMTAGELTILDMSEFILYIGQSNDEKLGIFDLVTTGGALEDYLRKRYHMYIQVATLLHNTQSAACLTGVV